MDWIATKTWNTSDIVTAAHMNAYWRDDLDYLKDIADRGAMPSGLDADRPTSPAVGDTYYATDTGWVYVCLATGTWSRLWQAGDAKDMVVQASAPANPAAGYVRLYARQEDADNDVLCVKTKIAGTVQEVILTSPRIRCPICGRTVHARDPILDPTTGEMIWEGYCGHIFAVSVSVREVK